MKVLDGNDKPIPKVEVMVQSPSGGGRSWFADSGANVLFHGELPRFSTWSFGPMTLLRKLSDLPALIATNCCEVRHR